jgi:hypothetical protein
LLFPGFLKPVTVFFLRALLAGLLLAASPAAAWASVTITFYSHEFGSSFPHAFVTLAGVDDRTGAKIDANYGFTATHISPAILFGPVKGEIFSRDSVADAQYLKASDPHFRLQLTDEEFDTVKATVAKWAALRQPSYDLNRRNCVHFVADVAATLGMAVEQPKALMKKPRSYLEFLTGANRAWLSSRSAEILRAAPAAQASGRQTQ